MLESLAVFDGRRVLRNWRGRQIDLLLDGEQAVSAFQELSREAAADFAYLPALLVAPSAMVH